MGCNREDAAGAGHESHEAVRRHSYTAETTKRESEGLSIHLPKTGLSGVVLGVLLGCALLTVGRAQEPLLVVQVPAVGAEAQVSADGKYCIVVLPSDSRGYDSLYRCPTEMQLVDLSSKQVAVRRALTPLCAPMPSRRRTLTPDGQFYCWFVDDRSIAVSRVIDGLEVHRADLITLGLAVVGCRDNLWLSDDGTFFVAEAGDPESKRRQQGIGWVRVEFTPSTRVAATLPARPRSDALVLDTRMCGDRENGRIVAVLQRKSVFRHVLMNMDFETLAESPVNLPAACTPYFTGAGPADNRLLLIMPLSGWFVFSTKGDRLVVAQSGPRYPMASRAPLFSSGAISPDGQYLVLCKASSPASQGQVSLSVWSVSQARPIVEVPVDAEVLFCCRFDMRGKYLSATSSKKVYVWDFAGMVSSAGRNQSSSSE